jgi:guanosine-3',5'-bis(diphosphate) 3'-pyrophosphohydrolase
MRAVLDVVRAFDFAAKAHRSQRRKGEAADPYVNHLAEVSRLLAEATQGRDKVLIIAGLLHDCIEDVGVTEAELTREFGRQIARLVAEVTDDKRLPKAERKRLQVETVAKKSRRAKMLKLADKTSNLRSLVATPPADWDLARKREYFQWAKAVVAGCRGVSRYLERRFDAAWRDGLRQIS